MGVRTSRAKRADTRTPRIGACLALFFKNRGLPRRYLLLNYKRCFCERNVRIKCRRMQTRHQRLMLELQENFCESGNPGGGFQMADVRFRRTNRAKLYRYPARSERPRIPLFQHRTKRLLQSRDFNRVPQGSSGTVRFQERNGSRVNVSLPQGFSHHRRLCVRVGNCVAVSLTAMIDTGRLDEGVDMIAVPSRL